MTPGPIQKAHRHVVPRRNVQLRNVLLMIANGSPLLGLLCTFVGCVCVAVQVWEGVQAIRSIHRSRNDR
jgi:hypothetical protein